MYVRREGVQTRPLLSWPALRQSINTSFYIRYTYAYVLVKNETVRFHGGISRYRKTAGVTAIRSPRMNYFCYFAEAERWMNEQKNQRLNFDSTERSNTKWTFLASSIIEVKFVLDNQPTLRTGPLPDMVAQSCTRPQNGFAGYLNSEDNFCLWPCIAVCQGATRPENTGRKRVAKELLQPKHSSAQICKNFA